MGIPWIALGLRETSTLYHNSPLVMNLIYHEGEISMNLRQRGWLWPGQEVCCRRG